jgi:hypothetical protein
MFRAGKSVDDFDEPIDAVKVATTNDVLVRLRHGVEIFHYFIHRKTDGTSH